MLESIGRGEKIRTFDPLHPMQVRYQAALRPDGQIITQICSSGLDPEHFGDGEQLGAQQRRREDRRFGAVSGVVETVARAIDGKALAVKQFADAAYEQDFVVLVIAAVAAPLDGF